MDVIDNILPGFYTCRKEFVSSLYCCGLFHFVFKLSLKPVGIYIKLENGDWRYDTVYID